MQALPMATLAYEESGFTALGCNDCHLQATRLGTTIKDIDRAEVAYS